MKCWIVEQGLAARGSCAGELVKAHLIPKQRIKRQFPRGAEATWRETSKGHAIWRPVGRGGPETPAWIDLHELVWDRRVWVPICGGAMGNAGHHGAVDSGGVGKIVIPREKLPEDLEDWAEEHGFEWSLEADYGPKTESQMSDITQDPVHVLTLPRMRDLLDRIEYLDRKFLAIETEAGFFVQIRYMETCVITGELEEQAGRKWYVSRYAVDSEVIQTALKAALASAEHVVREHFKVDGVLPYGPHMDVERLVALCKAVDPTDSRPARP